MVSYNPKEWFTFIFRFHKFDTVRALFPLLILMAVYSGLVAYMEMSFWKLSENSHVGNIPIMHGILSFVISMLLVFRTNTAYDRWWEGRKLWGSLVNNSRNLAIKLSAMLPKEDQENRLFFKKTISAYAHALKNHLNQESTRTMLFEDAALQKSIAKDKHVPNQIALMLATRISKLRQENIINDTQLLMLNGEITTFTDVCGACERIKNTPIPYSYSAFIKKFIFIYVMTLPFGYVFKLGYYVIPVVCFILYVLASLELIAEEIEDPFGADGNDLPMDKIATNIHKHVYEIL